MKQLKHLKPGYAPIYEEMYTVSDDDRMFCYLWYEQNTPDECKFGQRWVRAGHEPYGDNLKRIRGSLEVRHDIYDEGLIKFATIWDVSQYAKAAGKFNIKAKIDDHIRNIVGFKKKCSEVHTIPYDVMKTKVDEVLCKSTQTLPIVRLSSAQYETLVELKTSVLDGKRRILGELAARFGKTIDAAALAVELTIPVTIIASYVKTAFTSFRTDITSFEQFRNIVHINTEDDNYQQQITTALANKQQIFVYLSLNNGSHRQPRIDYVFGLDEQRLVIIDEADFGAHRKTQVDPLKAAICANDILFLMTGSNADRAVGLWDIDHMLSVTYFELLVQKGESSTLLLDGVDPISNPSNLEHFTKSLDRDVRYPSMECYQLDLIESVNNAIKTGLVPDDMKTLPSWTKFVKNPLKAKGWYTQVLQALFQGRHNLPALNIDIQTKNPILGQRVSMLFFPDNTQVNLLKVIGDITATALPDVTVITLSGQITTQEDAERYVDEIMFKNPHKSILILSAKIGQRSFSISKLDELYLAYDKGQAGATIQKMSRPLTPAKLDKVGKIYSLSFDSNRDDKFDTVLVQTALNLVKRKKTGATDITLELTRILNSIDIFSCTPDGAIKVNADTFITEALKRKTISKVMGMKTDITGLSDAYIEALANGNINYIRNEARERAKMGKTQDAPLFIRTKKRTPAQKKDLQKVREMFATIYENSDILLNSGRAHGAKNIKDCFRIYEQKGWEKDISAEFGVDYIIIKQLFMDDRINEHWVHFLHKTL